MASFTVLMFSASSSGMSSSKSSSNFITSSTMSSESAPRSSTKEAVVSTWPSSTPSCSTMICFTLSATTDMSPPNGTTKLRFYRVGAHFATRTLKSENCGAARSACRTTPLECPALLYHDASMTRVLYLHGFASSPKSRKAQLFRKRFAEAGVDLEISDLEQGAFRNLTIGGQLRVIEQALDGEPAHLIGSSM